MKTKAFVAILRTSEDAEHLSSVKCFTSFLFYLQDFFPLSTWRLFSNDVQVHETDFNMNKFYIVVYSGADFSLFKNGKLGLAFHNNENWNSLVYLL